MSRIVAGKNGPPNEPFPYQFQFLIAEEKRMHSQTSKFIRLAFAAACASLLPLAIAAQNSSQPAPSPAKTATSADAPSKWDIFAGFSYLAPHGKLIDNGTTQDNAKAIACCVDFSVARFFNKYAGVQAEGDFHKNGGLHTAVVHNTFSGGSGGLIFRFPTEDITPFVHALVGGESVASNYHPSNKWGIVLTAGGGVDYATPLLDHHLSIRVFQADFQYVHDNMYPVTRGNFNNARLSTGLVVSFGSIAPPATVTLSCAAQPTSVFPGEPVTVTATAANLLPKDHVVYSWSGQGVTGTNETAKVDTTNLAPGNYTVNCGVKEGKPGKEGLKPWESASSTAPFTVKEYEPPTISCSANPTDLKPGDSSTITCNGVSPQNRPLTYSYEASAGTITGNGTTATYSSTGAPTGPVQITGKVSDDKGHTATANTSLNIQAPPPPPPAPKAQALCSIAFENDKKRPLRVDNEAKACLDEVALALQKQPDAKAVVVGEASADEKAKFDKEQKLASRRKHGKPAIDPAAQRAVNTKAYLVDEKGIDASRISAATSQTEGQKVEDYLVPPGADFNTDVQGTTPVDESTVKPQTRKPLPERHHGKAKSSR